MFKKLLIIPFLVLVSSSYYGQGNPDYSITENWAVLPDNYPDFLYDFSTPNINDSVDVFYCYPTLITSKKDKRWNVPIEDSVQQEKVLKSAVKFQASAWVSSGNLYVPFYRQAHIRSYYELDSGGRDALLLAYSDVKAAFEYYLEHFNNGKAIILAGHSQGSTHISMLLQDFFDNKPLQKQLIAAYIPGIGLDTNHYESIKLMDQPTAFGGFLAWNTFKKKFDQSNYHFYEGKSVINPVTWDTSTFTPKILHQGFLFSNGNLYKNSFNTHLDDGVIWITTPKFPFRYLAFTMDNYHVGDVNLFWEDIRQNAILRVKSYFEANLKE
jgi:hypothetical protein